MENGIVNGFKSVNKTKVADCIQTQLPDIPPKAIGGAVALYSELYFNDKLSYEITVDDCVKWLAYVAALRMERNRNDLDRSVASIILEASEAVLIPLYPKNDHLEVYKLIERVAHPKTK